MNLLADSMHNFTDGIAIGNIHLYIYMYADMYIYMNMDRYECIRVDK
jgi:hypothetical protein